MTIDWFRYSIVVRLLSSGIWKFGIVGIVQNTISIAAILLLTSFGLAAWQAFAIVFPLAVLFTYILNSRWTFQTKRRSTNVLSGYVAVYIFAYGLTLALSYLLERMAFADVVNAGVTVGVVGIFTFVALDRFVFRQTQTSSGLPTPP